MHAKVVPVCFRRGVFWRVDRVPVTTTDEVDSAFQLQQKLHQHLECIGCKCINQVNCGGKMAGGGQETLFIDGKACTTDKKGVANQTPQ